MANANRKPTRKLGASPVRRAVAHPAVWLATVGTLVSIATGMFTLRDQVFPSESGNAQAPLDAYRQSVGDVCRELNDDDDERVRSDRRLKKELHQAQSLTAQRNALLDSARRSENRSS